MINVGLYLIGNKGFKSLESISILINLETKINISFIVCSKDINIQKDYFEEIKLFAEQKQFLFYERNQEPENLNADIIFAIGWRWIINQNIQNLYVLHDSILPQLRGFNPLVTALIEGHSQIGVTAIKADKEFDKGNIVGVKTINIEYPIKIQKAIEIVSDLYSELIVQVIQNKLNNKLVETIQNEEEATYSLWRNEEDYEINWNLNANQILRTINALGYPYKGASTLYDGRKIRIINCEIINDLNIVNRIVGKIILITDNQPIVVCGVGLIKITESYYSETNESVNFSKLRIKLK